MPRGQFFGHREALPDPKYRDKLVGKFLNMLMERWKEKYRRADLLRSI